MRNKRKEMVLFSVVKKQALCRRKAVSVLALALVLSFCLNLHVIAAGEEGALIVSQGFDVIYTIIAAIVSSVGSLYLLWGIFEWAQSLNTQDGGAQSMSFKRIASGLVAIIGPQLVPIIQNAVGVV